MSIRSSQGFRPSHLALYRKRNKELNAGTIEGKRLTGLHRYRLEAALHS